MPRLTAARAADIDTIFGESYALWGAGLSFGDYRDFWIELGATAWARRYLSYLVWLDDRGVVLSSLKLYRPRIRIAGKAGRAAGIGAVFTPRAHRRRGHATAMLRQVLREARARKDMAAILFSDIGTGLYSAIGFREIPAEEAWGVLPRRPTQPPAGWSLRPMSGTDLTQVSRVHEEWCADRPFAMLRDATQWEYLVERTRSYFERLDGSDLSGRFLAVARQGEFAGYLVAVESGDVWVVREALAAGGDPESLAAILRLGATYARARRLRRVYGWLPREVAEIVPEWRLTFRARKRALPMLVRTDGGDDLSFLRSPGDAFIPYLDQF